MLRRLHIENIAVIKCVDLAFESGFSVLTGETGAGKSIIIDSINLLVGTRASRELLRTGEKEAIICAVFDDLSAQATDRLQEIGIAADDGCILMEKRLHADGKSTARINGRPVTLGMLRQAGKYLINIHGQNDSQSLLSQETHIGYLDAYVKHTALLASYESVYEELRETEKVLASIQQEEAEKLRMREMLLYQLRDINSVAPTIGEEETLEGECVRLQNIERIRKQVSFCNRALNGGEKGSAASLIGRSASAMEQIGQILPDAASLAERLRQCTCELCDIAEAINALAEEPEEDPSALLDKYQERLDAIAKLKRKYGSTVADVLSFRDTAAKRLRDLDNTEERSQELTDKINRLQKQANIYAEQLHENRIAAAKEIEQKMTETLGYLDMPRVRFSVSVTKSVLCPNGFDRVEFLIATNPGEALAPLQKIASGGELSRIMLSLSNVLNNRDAIGCTIYDEIDTGISGSTSRRVGIKLKEIARNAQVICVTHSAQIASLADKHFFVSKTESNDRTFTEVHTLSQEERCEEIARIIGGISVTDAQRQAARDMLSGLDESP